MPTYVITAPDGKEYEIDTPEGATQEQALAYFQSNWKPEQKVDAGKTAEPEKKSRSALDIAGDVAAGMTSVPRGVLNLLSGEAKLGNRLMPQDYVDKESMAYSIGQALDPASWALGGAAMKGAQMLPKLGPVVQGMLGGAVGGGAVGGLTDEGSVVSGATIGGLVGGAIPGAAAFGGRVVDAATGNQTALRAQKILKDVTGDKLAQVRQLWQQAPDNITAAQAAAPAESTTLSALGERASRMQSQPFRDIAVAQEAARRQRLQQVTPDLEQAASARSDVKDVMYGKAYASDRMRRDVEGLPTAGRTGILGEELATPVPRIPELEAIKDNSIIKAAARTAKDMIDANPQLAHLKGTNPLDSLEGLHVMKLAIDSQFKDPVSQTALRKYSQEALQLTKNRLTDAMNKVSPLYKQARERFAEMSVPVNQAQVMQQLSGALEGPAGQERVAKYLGAMTEGQKTLLRRANQQPRFGGVEDILAPEQMTAARSVAEELKRDIQVSDLAKSGADELAGILRKDASRWRLPNLINRYVSTANYVVDAAEEVLNKKTAEKLYTAMQSGAKAEELMKVLPAKERVKILKYIYENNLTPYAATGAAAGAQ